jgi:four helix bundle protein
MYSRPMQDYRNLKAWAKAHALLLNVNRAIRRFPREYASLRSQTRRAAESIPTNLVEGSAFESDKEFAKYVQTSISSSSELEYHLRVARDYELLEQQEWASLTRDVSEVRMMLTGLIKKLRGD